MAYDNFDRLYDNLKEDGYIEKSREHFRAFVGAPGEEGYRNRLALYKDLKEDGYVDSPTYEEFARRLGLHAAEKSSERSAKSDSNKGSSKGDSTPLNYGGRPSTTMPDIENPLSSRFPMPQTPVKVEGDKPLSPERWNAFRNGTEAAIAGIHAQAEEGKQRIENVREYTKGLPRNFQGGAVKSGKQFNPETGKLQDTYVTPFGERSFDKGLADMATRDYNFQADMTVGGQLRRAGQELDDLRRRRDERVNKLSEQYYEDFGKNVSPIDGRAATSNYMAYMHGDKEKAALDVAIRQKEEQIKTLQEEADRQGGKSVGFWRGFGRAVKDIRTWDFGIGDMTDAVTMLNADYYYSDKANEKEQTAGRLMMESLADKQMVDNLYASNASRLNRWGSIAGFSVSFMKDFMLTGGFGKVATGVPEALAKGFAMRAAKRMGGDLAAKRLAVSFAKDGLFTTLRSGGKGAAGELAKAIGKRGIAETLTIKALGVGAEDLLIRAPLMAATVQGASTASKIIETKLGPVEVDEENNELRFANDASWSEAAWEAGMDQVIENYSEMWGGHLPALKLTDITKYLGAQKLTNWILKSTKPGTVISKATKLLSRAGMNGYFGEVGEEYYGQLWRTGLGLESASQPKFDKDGNPVYMKDADGNIVLDENGQPIQERENNFMNGEFHGDIWGGMALSIGLTGGGTMALGYAGKGIVKGSLAGTYAYRRHKVNVADRRATEILGKDIWEPMRTIIDGADNGSMGDIAAQVMADTQYTDAEREALMDYMEESMKMRGHNLGELLGQRASAGNVNTDSEGFDESYLNGYNASSPREMNDVKNMLDYQRQRLGQYFSEETIAQMEEDGAVATLDLARQIGWDSEERVAVTDYFNAKMVYDGMLQGVRDGIEEEIAAMEARIDSHVNRTTGRIESAKMSVDDRKVYIVAGNLAVGSDGKIDRSNSDESLLIRDAETGKLEFCVPKDIIGVDEALDPMTEKLEVAENIRQEHAQRAAASIDGKLPFNPGDKYTIDDGSGQMVEVTLVGQAMDSNGAPLSGQYIVQWPNGQTTSFEAATLQAMADAANLERLNQFEQERQAQRQQSGAPASPAKIPRYNVNDVVTLKVGDRTVRGSVTAAENEDGMIEIYTEEPINGRKVNLFTPRELNSMLKEIESGAIENDEVIEPVGRGMFGNIYDQFKGKVKEAVRFLFQQRSGEAKGVFTREEIGSISLIWGDGKSGLQHIIEKHVIKHSDYNSVKELLDKMSDVISNGDITIQKGGNYRIEKDGHRVVIAKNEDGDFVLTAYDNTRSAEDKKRSDADATLFDQRVQDEMNGTLVSSGVISESKINENDLTVQERADVSIAKTEENIPNSTENAISDTESESEMAIPVGNGQQTALQRIQLNEQGKPDFAAAETAELGWDALVEKTQGDEEMAQTFADNMVKAKETALTQAEKVKPKANEDIDAFMESELQRKGAIAKAKAELEAWQRIAQVRQNREAEAANTTGGRAESDRGKKPTLIDAVKALYQHGKEYATKLYQRTFFDVATTPDFIKSLGLTGDKFTIRYGVIAKHANKDADHNLSIEIWEQLPDALQRPFAITKHFEKKNGNINQKGFRIYTALKHNGKYVIVGADVKNAGRDLEINSISTVFAITSPSELEDVIYTSKEITPEQQSLLDGRNSHQYPAERESSEGKDNTLSSEKQDKTGKSSEERTTDSLEERLAVEREKAEREEEERLRKQEEAADREAKKALDKRVRHAYEDCKDSELAMERLRKTNEPEDIYEAASIILSGTKILWGDRGGAHGAKRETGFKEGERRKLFTMFASKENGGKSIGYLAGDPMLELCEEYGIPYDNQEAFNALIEVIYSAKIPSDIKNYIVNTRLEQAYSILESEQDYYAGLEEQYYYDNFGMGKDEFMDYEEVRASEARAAVENMDYSRYNEVVAEQRFQEEEEESLRKEILDEEARISAENLEDWEIIDNIAAGNINESGNGFQENEGNDASAEGGNGGQGGKLLPGTQIDKPGGGSPVETEQGGGRRRGSQVAGKDGGVSSGTSRGGNLNAGNGIIGRSLTEKEATKLVDRMEGTAEEARMIELTPENWIEQFGVDGQVTTPMGIVKLGENQFMKLYNLKRAGYFGMMYPTLSNPDVVIEKSAPAIGAERDSKLLFVKTFTKPNGGRVVHFESITVKRDGLEVSISSHEAEGKAIKREMQNGKILHLNEKLSLGSEWYLTEALQKAEGPDLVPTSDNIPSEGKDNTLSSEKQDKTEKSSEREVPESLDERELTEAEIDGAEEDRGEEVNHGAFGKIYTQFKNKAKEAIAFLLQQKRGEAVGALHHHSVGEISIVWGNKKAGLEKIASKHPEVLDNLQEVIDAMEVVEESDNRIKLESPTHFAVVSKEWFGQPRKKWLLTAYEKKETPESIDKTMDTDENPTDLRDDTAPSQNSGISEGKGSQKSSEKQDKTEKSSAKEAPQEERELTEEEIDGAEVDDEIKVFAVIDKGARIIRRASKSLNIIRRLSTVAKAKNYATGKMEPDMSVTPKGISIRWKRGSMSAIESTSSGFAHYGVIYISVSSIASEDYSYLSKLAREYKEYERRLELEDKELLREMYCYNANPAEVRESISAVMTLIEELTGKTKTQLSNLAEGKLDNEIAEAELTLEEYEDIFRSLNDSHAATGALGEKVINAVKAIPGITFACVAGSKFRGKRNVLAHYIPSENRIELNSTWFNSLKLSEAQKAECMIHEMIHSLTCWAIGVYKTNPGMLSAEQKKAVEDIMSVYNQINNDRFRATLRLNSEVKDNAEYGLTSPEEMIAELANPVFRAALRTLSLWRTVINGVKRLIDSTTAKLLGIEVSQEESARADIILENALDTLMSTFSGEVYEEYSANPGLYQAEGIAFEKAVPRRRRGASSQGVGSLFDERISRNSEARQLSLFGNLDETNIDMSHDAENPSRKEQRANDAIDAYSISAMELMERLNAIDEIADEIATEGMNEERRNDLSDITGAEAGESVNIPDFIEQERGRIEEELSAKAKELTESLGKFYSEEGNSEEDSVKAARDMVERINSEISLSLIRRLRDREQREEFEIETEGKSEADDSAAVKTAGGATIRYRSLGALRRLKPGEFIHVERQLARNGEFAFTGSEVIETTDDVAFIFRSLENYAEEHVFAVFVKDGEAKVLELGLGSPTATVANMPAIYGGFKAFGADKVYVVHNHPSGNMAPSPQDRQMLKKVEEILPEIEVGGIIIDITSGRYSDFQSSAEVGTQGYETRDISRGEGARSVDVERLTHQEYFNGYNPEEAFKISSSRDVAEFISTQRLSTRGKISYLLLSHSGNIIGNFHTRYVAYEGNESSLADEIAMAIVRYGGSSAVVYGNAALADRASLRAIKARVNRRTGGFGAFLDAVEIDNGLGGGGYRSAMDMGLMEQGVKYGAEGDERFRLGDSRTSFKERQRKAVENRGTVMPGLNEAEVKVVDVPRHEFRGTGREIIKQAKDWARKNLIGKYTNSPIGNYEISSKAVSKYLSNSAISKSENLGIHIATLQKLPSVIESSILVESHPDYTKIDEHRRAENRVNDDIIVHRLYGAVVVDGKLLRVKTTMLEFSNDNVTNRPHSYEVTKIEILDAPMTDTFAGTQSTMEMTPRTSISSANLLKGVEKSYDKGVKILAESAKADSKQQERSPRQRMAEYVRELAKRLHLDNVDIVEDASGLQGRRAKAKGWYSRGTGRITIVLSNNTSAEDIERTLLHEAVAHYGLRRMFGKEFNTFLDKVYESASPAVRRKIAALAANNGWDFRTATEEYLASLAEDTNFEEMKKEAGLWSKVKQLFKEMLANMGMESFAGSSVKLGDAELRYILWASYQNLKGNNDFGGMTDAAMREQLNIDAESESDIEKGDLFRDGDFSPRDKAIARDAYNRMCESNSFQFREAMQDSMLGLSALYKSILGEDTQIEDVAGYENAYLYENRMSSTNAGEQYEYFIKYMKPLIQAIGAITGKSAAARQELTDYMMAKHGLERNERMRTEAAANSEKTDRDFAGLCGLTGKTNWQDAEDAARKIVENYERTHDAHLLDALWKKTNLATKATLEKIYLSGILSKKTYEKVRDMYKYYIPLRGWDETTSEEVYGYLTSKDGPLTGNIMKKAKGRESKADDPIATIGMMADAAIRQGNRNVMKQRFLNFVLNHPSDLVSVKDLWLAYNETTDEWEPVFANLTPDMTAEEVEAEVERFEAKIKGLAKAAPDKYKRGREAANIPYKVVKGNLREHQVMVKRNGRTYVLTINGNPRAAQALNGLTNPDVETNGTIGNLLKLGEYVNRQLSAFYTTRNPDFMVSNFFRDMLYSTCMSWVKESPRYAMRFHKNFGRVNPAQMRILFGKWTNGKLDMSNFLEKNFYDFMRNGGETGYTSVKDIEAHKKSVAKEIKKQGNLSKQAWSELGMQLELLNRSAENCARFAAFLTSREFGRSIDRSIYDAKEVSVNFNKKGSGGKMVNAVGQNWAGKVGSYIGGTGRLAYIFWNAGIQGTTNFGRNFKRHPKKAIAAAAAMTTLGFVVPMLAQMLFGGDDDDENAYYNLPEYVRRSNICINAGKQWLTIPLPIEFRALYGMGELTYGVISGNERYSNGELAYHLASQVSQILPLDMLEGGGGWHALTPSLIKPIAEVWLNKSWTGLPIYNDTPFNKKDPEWTKAYRNSNKYLVAAAKWLNEVSGGDEYEKGTIDINPAKVEYLLKGYLGGVFSFPDKGIKFGETLAGSRDFEWRNIPIANRIIKSGDERTAFRKLKNEYYKYKDEYEDTGRLMRLYEKDASKGILEAAEKADLIYNSPEYLRYLIFDGKKPMFDAYNETISAETDKGMKKMMETEMYGQMRLLVNALRNPESYLKKMAAD